MKTIVTLFSLLLALTSHAQQVVSSLCLGGTADEKAFDAAGTGDGGMIIVGYSESSVSGDVIGENHGGRDAWIVCLDGEGNILWQHLLGGTGHDVANGVAVMPAGEVFVTGTTFSADGDFSEHLGSDAYSDVFVAKFSSTGALAWIQTMGTAFDDSAADIVCAGANRLVIGGTIESVGNDVEMNFGLNDMWLFEMDGNGNVSWENTYGDERNDFLHHLAVGPDGGIYLAGQSEVTSGAWGDLEGRVIKTDADGEEEWTVNLGSEASTDLALLSHMAVNEEGELFVGYTTTGTELDGVNCTPHGSFLAARISSDGELADEWCYGGSALDRTCALFLDGNGDPWIMGTTRSTDGDVGGVVNFDGNQQNVWIARLSQQGVIQEHIVIAAANNEEGCQLLDGTQGMLTAVMTTWSSDGVAEGQHSDEDSETSDILLVGLQPSDIHVDEISSGQGTMDVWPNPADHTVFVSITDTENDESEEEIVIRDLQGRILLVLTAVADPQVIDVSGLAPGQYLVSAPGHARPQWLLVQ